MYVYAVNKVIQTSLIWDTIAVGFAYKTPFKNYVYRLCDIIVNAWMDINFHYLTFIE